MMQPARARRVAIAAASVVCLLLAVAIWRSTREKPAVAPAKQAALTAPVAAPAELPDTTLVTVTSIPSGAEVIDEDGQRLGKTPLEVPVVSGDPVRFVLRRVGYVPFTLARKSVSGARVALSAALKKDARAAPPAERPGRSPGYREDPY
jgi:hypothetical protein